MLHLSEDLKHAAVNTSASGQTEIVAAPGAGKWIAIDFIALNPDGGANTLILQSTDTELTRFVLDDSQPITFENAIHSPKGILTCADNEAFNLELTAATSVTGFVKYRIVE